MMYDLFAGNAFTPCPYCHSCIRVKRIDTVRCKDCGLEEAISANNARPDVVASLPPIGAEAN
jgi:hypothetical protein